MAPVVTSHLPRTRCLLVAVGLLPATFCFDASALLFCDHTTLFSLRHVKLMGSSLRTCSSSCVKHTGQSALCALQPRRRPRRQGKRGGLHVRIKGDLKSSGNNSGFFHFHISIHLYERRLRWIKSAAPALVLDWDSSRLKLQGSSPADLSATCQQGSDSESTC